RRLAGVAQLGQVATALVLHAAGRTGAGCCPEPAPARAAIRPAAGCAAPGGAAAARAGARVGAGAARALIGVDLAATAAGRAEGHRHAEREHQREKNASSFHWGTLRSGVIQKWPVTRASRVSGKSTPGFLTASTRNRASRSFPRVLLRHPPTRSPWSAAAGRRDVRTQRPILRKLA